MSPINRAGPVTGMNFALGSYEKFQPGFRDEKRSKILATSSGTKFGKQSNIAKHKHFNFWAYLGIGNSYRDLGNRASPPSHMNTLKILQRI